VVSGGSSRAPQLAHTREEDAAFLIFTAAIFLLCFQLSAKEFFFEASAFAG